MTQAVDPLAATRQWVETFVVARNVCPFAGREVARDTVALAILDAGDWEQALLTLVAECERLDETPAIETTLLVLHPGPRGLRRLPGFPGGGRGAAGRPGL